MDFQDKILAMVRSSPVTPTQVAKAVGKDSLIASAMLSALVEKGLLKVSCVKVGSTPLYYDPAHSDQLQNFASYLNEKDRKAYELLKEKKVLRENALDPLSRVCVKNIKDFSRPLEVSFGGTKEIFWKWYLLSDAEAEPLIRQVLSGEQQSSQQQPVSEPTHAPENTVEPPPQPVAPEEGAGKGASSSAPDAAEVPSDKKKPDAKPKAKKKIKKKKIVKKEESQKNFVDRLKDFIAPKSIKGSGKFLEKLQEYFKNNNIRVRDQLDQKRKSEFEFVVEVESAVGSLVYYCHAKDKKRVGEADLSNAFVQGQLMKLPVLFLTTGNLTKGAEKISKSFKGIAVRKI